MRAVAVAGLVLLAACSSSAPPGPSADDDTSTRPLLARTRCADLVVLGARGSTQSATAHRGVGAEVLVSVEALARRLHARSRATVRLEPIRYDASGVDYQAAVVHGADLATQRLRVLARACPDSRLAMIGFSMGGQVVHGAALDVPTALARRVAFVAMIADPRRNPGDAIVRWTYGTSAPRPGRLGAGTPIDADLRSRAVSLCVADDEICNARGNPGAPPSATHRHFYEKPSSARSTARVLDRVLRRASVG